MDWPECDGDFAVVIASLPGPNCTCVDTEVERTDCTQRNRRCLAGTCVECIEDRDCPTMGRPRCEGSNLINNRGRCSANTCSIVGVPTFCEYGCEEDECLPEPPCPDRECPGTPGPPSCDEDVWVTPVLLPDPDDCDACIEVEQRWLCGGNEVCTPDLGCLPGGCDPCPVFDEPAPFCDGDFAVLATGFEQDPVTCACTETFRRTDCAAQGEQCSDGVCVER